MQHQARIVFDRMTRTIARVGKDIKPNNVHRFRTNSRRVEALVEQLSPDGRNKRKLLKQLFRLRKKAGRVRDLDVQIAFLKELKVPDRQNHRAQLIQTLTEEHSKQSNKLASSFQSDDMRKLRKRLRRAYTDLSLNGIDPLKLAFATLPAAGTPPSSDRALHAYRISAKRARYLAELVADSPAAKTFIEELRRAQDAVGDWHDISKLGLRAEKVFGSVRDSALVSALQNISRARFRRASSSFLDALRNVSLLRAENVLPAAAHKASQSSGAAVKTAAA